jgi:monofunctional biosynthetic peptidoglycan transglycosylase
MDRRLLRLGAYCFVVYLLWPYNILELKNHNPTTTSLIELRQAEARRTGRSMKPEMEWRNLEDISPALVHAVLLAEDDRFYDHHGFDVEQIWIAIQEDLSKKQYVYGGSTITQQLARTLFLRPKKSIVRKLKEAVLTVYLEVFLPKKRILELYLNAIEWGPGVYGAEAASQYYFWKPASQLTPDEGVALASILPSPRRWSPFSEKAFIARRRTQLLERMQKAGYAQPNGYPPSEWSLPYAPVLNPPPDNTQ